MTGRIVNAYINNMNKGHMVEHYGDLLDTSEALLEGLKLETAEEVCRMMEKAQLSRAQLARVMGVSKAHVTQMLSGSRNFTLESLAKIAWHCGYDLHFRAIRHTRKALSILPGRRKK